MQERGRYLYKLPAYEEECASKLILCGCLWAGIRTDDDDVHVLTKCIADMHLCIIASCGHLLWKPFAICSGHILTEGLIFEMWWGNTVLCRNLLSSAIEKEEEETKQSWLWRAFQTVVVGFSSLNTHRSRNISSWAPHHPVIHPSVAEGVVQWISTMFRVLELNLQGLSIEIRQAAGRWWWSFVWANNRQTYTAFVLNQAN